MQQMGSKKTNGFERVEFDFSVDGGKAALKQLQGILGSKSLQIDNMEYIDERTLLFLKLVRFGDIGIYRKVYKKREETPELREYASELNWHFRKREVSGVIIDIASLMYGHFYDVQRTEFNSLYFPGNKTYVRCGGISLERLIGFFERVWCDQVSIFPDRYKGDEGFFHTIKPEIPKEQFLKELMVTQERMMAQMREVIMEIDDIIPAIDYVVKESK